MRRVLVLAAAVVFLDTIFFAALTPLLPHYARELGLSKAGAGILQAAYPAGTFLAAIPSGVLVARAGVKTSVLLGLSGLAVTSVAFGLADSAWLLDTVRFLQGASSSCSWTGALAWLVAAAPSDRRSEQLGFAMGAAIFGGLLGPVLGAVASLAGTLPAFGTIALAAAALGVWAWRTPVAAAGERQPLRELFAALHDRQLLLAAWFVLLPALLFGVLSVLAPLKLSSLGFGAVAIGAVFLTSGVFEALLSPTLGRIIDRIGPLRPIQAGLVAAAIVTAILPWPDHKWVLAAVVAVTGISFGAFWVPGFALLTERAEARGLNYGYAFALMNIAWSPGQGAGAAVGGILAELTSDAVPYLALSAICLASLVAVRRALGARLVPSKVPT